MKFLRFSLLFVFLSLRFFSQEYFDSIRKVIDSSTNDSIKIAAYVYIGYGFKDPQKTLDLLSEMIKYCESLKDEKTKALCLRKIGVLYHRALYYDKALEFTLKSAELFEKIGDKEGLANCYNNIGNSYNNKGDLTHDNLFHDRAIEYHLKCIKLREEINDTSQMQNSFNNIGNCYMSKADYPKALEYYNKAYAIYSANVNDGNGIHMVNLNLGDAYLRMGTRDNNTDHLKTAFMHFRKIYEHYRHDTLNERTATALTKMGQIYCQMGNMNEGIHYLLRGFKVSMDMKHKGAILDAAEQLAAAYEKKGDYRHADEYLHIFNNIKDSLINERNRSSVEQMQALYQSSQKDREIEKLNTDREIQDARINRQRIVMFSFIGGLVMILVLGFVLLSRYNLKKKANLALTDAYQKIENKNRLITDSINYSRRIQNAILPPLDLINKHLNGFFVFYAPKDIVSGDFYWFSERNGKLFFIVADCTGHGVPGALMSMIGNTLLNEIIGQQKEEDPGKILHHLNNEVMNALHQQESDLLSQEDGMDISVCCLDKTKPGILKYASANHSIFVKTKSGITELRGDIYSIGGSLGITDKQFTSFEHKIEGEGFVVMSTDGYYDQFGGEKDTKFLMSRFEELIRKPGFEKNAFTEVKNAFDTWQGDEKQTDDVLVAGFKISS